MASAEYMAGRRKYQRPQAMLFANNPGTLIDGYYIPNGLEVGQQPLEEGPDSELNEFLILSDNNRSEISFNIERLERRERMVNGRMRSYHIADKLSIGVDWNLLPSRAFSSFADFDEEGKPANLRQKGNRQPGEDDSFTVIPNVTNFSEQYTTDGGAGGVELLDWYNTHQGSFWVYLSYDNYKNFGNDAEAFTNLNKYSEVIEVFFSGFEYSVVRRGGSNYDFWNISLGLEEV